jgi:DNA invertase Pin-like site-specific DNA recombinase
MRRDGLGELRLAEGPQPAILYAAKSTEDINGSIPTQLEDGRQLAEQEDLEVVGEYFDEAASAYRGDRGPELAAALEHAEGIGGSIIVQHSDRLARGDGKQARHLAELFFASNRLGVTLRSVQDDSTFQNPVLAVVMGERNREDSRRKAMSVKAGLKRRRKRGRFIGRPPLGYILRRNEADERVLVIDEASAATIRRIYAEFLAGKGLTAIARGLVADRVPTRENGCRWNATTVRAKLLNPIYTSLLSDDEGFIEATHEAIIDRKTWEKAQALHKATARTYKRGRPSAGKHLFRKGFLRCGVCGASMIPRTGRTSSGNLTESYYCYERAREPGKTCDMPYITRAKVDGAVYSYFRNLGLDLDIEATHDQMIPTTERKLAEASQKEQESEARLRRVKNDILATLLELQEILVREIRDAEGATELRAVLMRLFEGFVLHLGEHGQGHIELAGGRGWIEPLVIEYVTEGYSGLRPVLSPSLQVGSVSVGWVAQA